MNIKRIGLIGGSGVVGGGTNSGGSGSEDNLWEITPEGRLNHSRTDSHISISSSIVISHIGKSYTDTIDISADDGINIDRDYESILQISPGVAIGTGLSFNKNVFIGSNVYIESGFDSRNTNGGLWGLTAEYVYVGGPDFNIKLGTEISIGSDSIVTIGKYAGIQVDAGSSSDSIFIGSGVYIGSGFDSRTISSGGGDSLWTIELGSGVSINRPDVYVDIVLGSSVNIGSDVYIESGFDSRNISGGGGNGLWKTLYSGVATTNESIILNPEVDGILLKASDNSELAIGTHVVIGTDTGIGFEVNIAEGIKLFDIQKNEYRIQIGSDVLIGTNVSTLPDSTTYIAKYLQFSLINDRTLKIKNANTGKYTTIELTQTE